MHTQCVHRPPRLKLQNTYLEIYSATADCQLDKLNIQNCMINPMDPLHGGLALFCNILTPTYSITTDLSKTVPARFCQIGVSHLPNGRTTLRASYGAQAKTRMPNILHYPSQSILNKQQTGSKHLIRIHMLGLQGRGKGCTYGHRPLAQAQKPILERSTSVGVVSTVSPKRLGQLAQKPHNS